MPEPGEETNARTSAPEGGRDDAPHNDADNAAGEAPHERTVIDAAADLLQTIVDWLRQEAEGVVREKIVAPIQQLGLTLASASAAAGLAFLGIAFIAVGLFMLLGNAIGYPYALLVIGGVLMIGSVVFTAIKMRLMQK